MSLHLAQDEVSRHGVGTQQLHLRQEYFWLLVFHFRMRFEKWEGYTMGKLGFDHSNLINSRDLGKYTQNILRRLKGFKESQLHW